jgi:hypothetical protein
MGCCGAANSHVATSIGVRGTAHRMRDSLKLDEELGAPAEPAQSRNGRNSERDLQKCRRTWLTIRS